MIDRQHVAYPLMEAVGPEAFSKVGAWLRWVAGEHALEIDEGTPRERLLAPSVAWLAEAVTFFGPREVSR